jgi:hypothetical protein
MDERRPDLDAPREQGAPSGAPVPQGPGCRSGRCRNGGRCRSGRCCRHGRHWSTRRAAAPRAHPLVGPPRERGDERGPRRQRGAAARHRPDDLLAGDGALHPRPARAALDRGGQPHLHGVAGDARLRPGRARGRAPLRRRRHAAAAQARAARPGAHRLAGLRRLRRLPDVVRLGAQPAHDGADLRRHPAAGRLDVPRPAVRRRTDGPTTPCATSSACRTPTSTR